MVQIEGYEWFFPIFSYVLVGGLAYGSQILFKHIEPGSLSLPDALRFNILVLFTFIGYGRSWLTDPGGVPVGWQPSNKAHRSRWCRKCEAYKPARAHHCKTCKRCIPKMDHHCPWTVNCVSHRTLGHFLRFLIYGVWASVVLEGHLYTRIAILWRNRDLPSYLGPSALNMGVLFTLTLVNTITLLAVGILLIRCLWSLFTNVTSIESWEIERHATLLRRARTLGGYLDGPDGKRIPIGKQEFPYDIGIWSNLTQVFGNNPLTWLWPFAATPSSESGLEFKVNDFEDQDTIWPPPDPDRMPRTRMKLDRGDAFLDENKSDIERKNDFLARQAADLNHAAGIVSRRKRFHDRFEETIPGDPLPGQQEDGEEAWRTADGERLADYGLDEDAEFYDEEDIPLGQLAQLQGKYKPSTRS